MSDDRYCLFMQGPNKKILCQLSMLKRSMSQSKAFCFNLYFFKIYCFSVFLNPNMAESDFSVSSSVLSSLILGIFILTGQMIWLYRVVSS